jgi:hypothetical protein
MSGSVDYDRESGKCAYDTYSRSAATTGQQAPPWEELPPAIQAAWIAAAKAVRERESRRETQF